MGLGRELIQKLIGASKGHRKIILYAVPGREPFYAKFGFRRMKTAMAIFADPEKAAADGYTEFGHAASSDGKRQHETFQALAGARRDSRAGMT